MDNSMPKQGGDRIFDLRSLLFYILKKWKMLVLFLVIGALIGLGLSIQKNHSVDPDVLLAQEDQVDLPLLEQYRLDARVLEDQADTMARSPLFQTAPDSLYTAVVDFCVSSQTTDAVTAFQLLLQQPGVVSDLYKVSGMDCGEDAFSTLLNVEATDVVFPVWENTENAFLLTLRYTFIAPSKEVCSDTLNELLVIVHDPARYLPSDFVLGEYDLSIYASSINSGLTDEFIVLRSQKLAEKDSFAAQVKQERAAFSSLDERYYTHVMTNPTLEKPALNPMPIVVCAAAAVILLAVWYCIVFIFGAVYRSEKELSLAPFPPVVTTLDLSLDTMRGLTKWLEEQDNKASFGIGSPEYLSSAIRIRPFDKALLCTDDSEKAFAELADTLCRQDARLLRSGPLSTDEQALALLSGADGVYIPVFLDRTRRSRLLQELTLARTAGKEVFGLIVVK